MDRPRSTPQKHYFSPSDTHFRYRQSKPHKLVRLEGAYTLKISFSSSGLEPATFRFVALYYCVSPLVTQYRGKESNTSDLQSGGLGFKFRPEEAIMGCNMFPSASSCKC
jgi:hypothetical protein